MSSEEEALMAVWDAIWALGRAKAAYDADRNGKLETVEPYRDTFNAALDAYRTAIERRVLAQQPLPLEIVRIYGKLSDYEDQGIFLCGPGHPLWESTLRELCQAIRKEFGPLMGSDLMSMPIAAQPQETSG